MLAFIHVASGTRNIMHYVSRPASEAMGMISTTVTSDPSYLDFQSKRPEKTERTARLFRVPEGQSYERFAYLIFQISNL